MVVKGDFLGEKMSFKDIALDLVGHHLVVALDEGPRVELGLFRWLL